MDKLKKDQIEQLLEVIKIAIKDEGEMVIMVRGGEHTISAVQGNPKDLGYMIAKAMRDEKVMFHIFKTAVTAIEKFGDFMKSTGLEDLLDCENCLKKEDCTLFDDESIMDKLNCKIDSGEVIPMSKGGEA